MFGSLGVDGLGCPRIILEICLVVVEDISRRDPGRSDLVSRVHHFLLVLPKIISKNANNLTYWFGWREKKIPKNLMLL